MAHTEKIYSKAPEMYGLLRYIGLKTLTQQFTVKDRDRVNDLIKIIEGNTFDCVVKTRCFRPIKAKAE